MQCPKCHSIMEQYTLSTLSGRIEIDQCIQCKGLWFDTGEAEILKDKWMSDYIDRGNRKLGVAHNKIRNINCPRCGNKMQQMSDPVQKHIQYEACPEHGMYLDAGEFTDYKHETLIDIFRDFIFALKRNKSAR